MLCCLLLYGGIIAAQEEHLFVVSGVVVNSDSGKKVDNFIKMIEKESAYKLKPYYVRSYARLSEILQANPKSLAWTCGAPFVEDSIKDGQQLIAIPLYENRATYRSFIVSRKEDAEKKLLDFKGKIFAYSDPRSNSGFVVPAAEIKKQGYDIKTFFSTNINTGLHEKSIEAVYRGVADVAAIDEYVWVEYTKKHPKFQKELHVIEKIGPYAFTPIVAGKEVSKETIKKIQEVLIGMNKEELARFKKDFNMDGFVLKDKSFYESIKKNMLLLGIDLQE